MEQKGRPRAWWAQRQERFDDTQIEMFGDPATVFDDDGERMLTAEQQAEAESRLAGFAPGDYLVLAGMPELVAYATLEAAKRCGGTLNVLVWRGKKYSAKEVLIDVG